MSLTVACCWVKANVPYGVEYVANLRAMVARHLARPHRFVCLTDRPHELPAGVEPIAIHHDRQLFGWWAKVKLFTPGQFTGRVLYLDLDTVVVSSLDPIVDFASHFALVPPAGTFAGKQRRQVVRRFNSSVMIWTAGLNELLATAWTPIVADRLWGDQDWIGEQMPDAHVMPEWWFPRLSDLNGQPPSEHAKVVLSKVPKNHIAADLYPWLADAWRAA